MQTISINGKLYKYHHTASRRGYARIVRRTKECCGVWITQYEFAGEIEWTKHAVMLTNEQRAQIEAHAAKLAKADEVRSNRAKALQ